MPTMKDKRLEIRISEAKRLRWICAAQRYGVSLSAWIERQCDDACGESSAVPKERVCTVATPTVHPLTVDRKSLCRSCRVRGKTSCDCIKENA